MPLKFKINMIISYSKIINTLEILSKRHQQTVDNFRKNRYRVLSLNESIEFIGALNAVEYYTILKNKYQINQRYKNI
jgi:hypothetical protein